MKSETFKIELMESSHSFLSQILQYYKKKKKKKKLNTSKKKNIALAKIFDFLNSCPIERGLPGIQQFFKTLSCWF